MTNDVLKATVLEAQEEVTLEDVTCSEVAEIFLRRLQPLVDADRQKTERLKEALRFYADKENYNKDIPGCNDGVFWICDGGNTACTALGEEK